MSQKLDKKLILNLIRRGTQILAFIFLPGLFTSTFYAIRSIYQSVLNGDVNAISLTSSLLIIFATIPLTILLGRFFCGFFCSFGSMGDFIWFISRKTLKPKYRVPEKVDATLKYGKYVVLVFLVIFAWTLQLSFLDSQVSPWNVFGLYASFGNWPAVTTWFSVGGALLIAIMIGSFFIERFFCRYLCPLGGIYAIFSKMRFFHIKKNRENCGSCKLCSTKCSMGIPLYNVDKVTSGECINCFNCVAWCPKKNAAVKPDPAVASAVSIVAITGLVYAGNTANAAMGNLQASTDTSSTVEQTQSGQYTDGTYSGSAEGFRGETEVSVEVSNGYITDVTIVSYEDDKEYFDRAKNTVISEIIEEQSTDVTAVSGATFSSNSIMDAVANALSLDDTTSSTSSNSTETNSSATTSESQSTKDSSNSSTTSEQATTDATSETENDANDTTGSPSSTTTDSSSTTTNESGSYTDGTYTGTGSGFRGDTEVSVTVESGKITDITVVSYQDDRQYFERAQSTVISEILETQNVDVTAVSGATFSSNGIMEAVADALGVSYTNSNSTNTKGGHGGGFKGR